MFSEDFDIVEKYNLNTQEHVSTIEMMPRRFTSLVDSSYLPALSSVVIDKLNKLFNYKQKHTTDPNYHFDKYLYVEHKDNDIMSFYCKNGIRFNTISHPSIWDTFIKETENESIRECRTEIDSVTNDLDHYEAVVMGISYDSTGVATQLSVYDKTYELNVSNSEILSKLNTLTQTRYDMVKGVVSILPDNTDIKYQLVFRYPEIFDNDDELFLNKTIKNTNIVDAILDMLSREGGIELITSEQKDYIRSICVGQSTFELEYIIGVDGMIKDFYVHQRRFNEFEDLTVG